MKNLFVKYKDFTFEKEKSCEKILYYIESLISLFFYHFLQKSTEWKMSFQLKNIFTLSYELLKKPILLFFLLKHTLKVRVEN